jgi:beta-lactamase regulating signal transducer with metallopeptidase domain
MPAYISLMTALGWSLLASFWQMALLWAGYHLLTAGNKRLSATGKHNLVLLFIVFSGEWFIYTFFHLLKEPKEPSVHELIPVSNLVSLWIPYISSLYLFILTIRLAQYVIQYRSRQDLKYPIPVSPGMQLFADRFSRILGITKHVGVYLSEKTETAETSGFLKPLILLPFSLLTRLSPAHVEAILIHELYHIRRNDYLINILVTAYRSIFFFNPFAHLFYKALERERELACDDGVLELGYDPSVYAEALFSLEKHRQVNQGFSLAIDGKKPWLLMERIQRVLGKPALREKRLSPMFLCGLAAAFVFFGLQFIALPGRALFDVVPDATIPVHYELAEENNVIPVLASMLPSRKEKRSLPPIRARRIVRHKKTREIEKLVFRVNRRPGELNGTDQAFYVDQNIVRNFSNESETGLATTPVEEFPGSPYVPSASLSHEAVPDNGNEDSAQQVLILNYLNDAETATRLHSVIVLKKLRHELEKSKFEVREVELKNKNMILMDKKNIQPILDKVHKQLKDKKKEIEKMGSRFSISPTEIIHI